MFNSNKIKPIAEFPYWFIRRGLSDVYDVFTQEVDDTGGIKRIRIGNLWASLTSIEDIDFDDSINDTSILDGAAIKNAFDDFKSHRPEYVVGMPIPVEVINTSGDNAAIYEELLIGCLLLQYQDDEKALKVATRFLDWLRSEDFYTAPASTRFHDSEPEGLLKHSLRTVNNAIMLMGLKKFADVAPHEAILCAAIHDVSKVGVYEQYLRNVKDEEAGTWSQVPSYRYKTSEFPFGHSTASMYLGQKYFPDLSMEQALALRHHMYSYGIAQSETSELSDACSRYPLVHLIQWADQSSITLYGQEG